MRRQLGIRMLRCHVLPESIRGAARAFVSIRAALVTPRAHRHLRRELADLSDRARPELADSRKGRGRAHAPVGIDIRRPACSRWPSWPTITAGA